MKKKILNILHVLVAFVCVWGSIYTLRQDVKPMPKVLAFICIVAVCLATIYVLRGGKKQDAAIYKAYMVTSSLLFMGCTCANAITLGAYEVKIATGLITATNTLIFGLFLLLAFNKDMGKKNSYILAATVQFFTLALLVCSGIFTPGIIRGGDMNGNIVLVRALSKFLLATIASISVVNKYEDKENRGTK